MSADAYAKEYAFESRTNFKPGAINNEGSRVNVGFLRVEMDGDPNDVRGLRLIYVSRHAQKNVCDIGDKPRDNK
jgi:hypothetical protein